MSCQLKYFRERERLPKIHGFFFFNNIQNLKLKNCFKVDLFYSFFFVKAQLHNLLIPNVDVLLCNRRIHHFSPSSIITSTASSIYFAPILELYSSHTRSQCPPIVNNFVFTSTCFCIFLRRKRSRRSN